MWCIWVFEEFWVTQNLGQSMLVTTPYCQWLLPLTNYGDQFQQRTLFILKQYCLEGILAKESSPRTKDFLLWRDLQRENSYCNQNCKNRYRTIPVFSISLTIMQIVAIPSQVQLREGFLWKFCTSEKVVKTLVLNN